MYLVLGKLVNKKGKVSVLKKFAFCGERNSPYEEKKVTGAILDK